MFFTSSNITEIIVSLVGPLGLIAQSIVTYKVGKASKAMNDKAGNTGEATNTIGKIAQRVNRSPKKYKWISIFIALIFTAAAVFGVKMVYDEYFTKPRITVSSPKPNDLVGATIDINGSYRNINYPEQLIWVAAYTEVDKKYFLHCCPADINPKDKVWANNNTLIGVDSDKGKKSRILVLLVDKKSECHEEILNHINDKSRHGLDNLPKGSQIFEDITVSIK